MMLLLGFAQRAKEMGVFGSVLSAQICLLSTDGLHMPIKETSYHNDIVVSYSGEKNEKISFQV